MKPNTEIIEEYALRHGFYRVHILQDGTYNITLSSFPSYKVKEALALIPYCFDLPYVMEQRDGVVTSLARKLGLSSADVEWLRAKLSGYDVLYPLMLDPKVTDIKVMANRQVLVRHQEYGDLKVALQGKVLVLRDYEVRDLAIRLASRAGTTIHVRKPLVDGVKLGRDRVVASIMDPPYVTIRKFPRHPWTLHKLVAKRMLTARTAALLWLLNEYKVPIMIYGPMGSGKTSLAGAIIATVKPRASIMIIQDIPEINIAHPYAHYLYPTPIIEYSKLLSFALRTGSEYLIVNEVRNKEEATTFVQAVNTGHGGVTTIHAESVRAIVNRLRHYGLTDSDISTIRVFVRTSTFEKRVKGMVAQDRKVLKVEHLDRFNKGVPSFSTFIEYDREGDVWIERAESLLLEVLHNRGYNNDVIRAKLKLREMWLLTLAKHYTLDRFIETSKEWYVSLKEFYSKEGKLLMLIDEPDELQSRLMVCVNNVKGMWSERTL